VGLSATGGQARLCVSSFAAMTKAVFDAPDLPAIGSLDTPNATESPMS
jgi:hypothetical protein